MKFMELNSQLKNQVRPLYNIIGEDDFLIKQAITNLKTTLIKDFEDFNFSKIDASKISASQFLAIISTLPFGSKYKLVVAESLTEEQIILLNKLDLNNSNIVLTCINAHVKNAEIIDCNKLERADIIKYVLNYLSKFQMQISERALDYLLEATSCDMSKVSNELNKLVSFSIDKKAITLDDTVNLVVNETTYAIFMLTNSIDNKDIVTYQNILDKLEKSGSSSEIFAYMGKHFKRMQNIALSKDDEELSKVLNIKPYAVKMSRQNITKNGIKYYLDLYAKYVDLDLKIKSGKISASNALFALVI